MRAFCALIVLVALLGGCQESGDSEAGSNLVAAEQRVRETSLKDEKKAAMLRVLSLDTAQAAALEQAYAARDEAVSSWLSGASGQRLIALEAKMGTAAAQKDLEGVRGAIAEATPLRNALRDLVKSQQEAILNVLTPNQQVQWAGYEVAAKLLDVMSPLQLGRDQIVAIEEGGVSAVARSVAQGAVNPKADAYVRLEQWVEDSVLSESQYELYGPIKKSNGLRSLSF